MESVALGYGINETWLAWPLPRGRNTLVLVSTLDEAECGTVPVGHALSSIFDVNDAYDALRDVIVAA
jgi:hypothetical protein